MHDSFSIQSYQCPYNLENNCAGQECPKWINLLEKSPQTEEELFLWCSCFEKDETGICIEASCQHFDKIFDKGGIHKNSSEITVRIPDIYWCANCEHRFGRCSGK